MTSTITRIAMWSGPRNISTAMMRAWENRNDTFVTDEPFYACYLAGTGIQHPGRDSVLASQSTDWHEVIQQCTSATDGPCSVHYQKHMTQHMLPEYDLDWLETLVNVFLIRSPEEVVASYSKTRPDLNSADLGYVQQSRLFEYVAKKTGTIPLVISAESVLKNPAYTLTAICDRAGIEFDENMLSWPAGKRESDGIWGKYWYKNVEKSTGFGEPRNGKPELTTQQRAIADQCEPYYNAMLEHCLVVE